MRTNKLFSILSVTLIVMLLMSSNSFAVYSNNPKKFKDVPSTHWAYNAIKLMTERQVLSGYSDNSFKPDNPVTREEFAKIMVLALNLPVINPQGGSFKDVGKNDWAYRYIESAKYYLTGFRTSTGDLFKPSAQAVREDMAVAMVKAMGYSQETADESLLDDFIDKDGISSNLRKYVAIAVRHEIMKGSKLSDSSSKAFNPQGILTRAEAATLLYNVISSDEEKVTYNEVVEVDEEEVPLEEEEDSIPYSIPSVAGKVENGKIILDWQEVKDNRFQYYKVVVSEGNPYPRYPDDGYLYVISDRTNTRTVIDNSTAYNGGDFGSYLKPGKRYYFSVTAVYKDIKLPGNAVALVYPGESEDESSSYSKPVVKAEVVNGKVVLKWNAVYGKGFNYYKVVVSKYNSSPRYPNDGYQTFISDQNKTSCTIQAGDGYNGGDFGGEIESGETYYFSITAVFGERKLAGNAVKLKVP